jgi:flagellar assembly protein FliH
MNVARKFLFDLDFDAPATPTSGRGKAAPAIDAPPPPPPPPPAPTFSETELAQAVAEARAAGEKEGIAKGHTEAMAQIEKQIASMLSAIGSQVATATESAIGERTEIASTAIEVARAVLQKLHPELARQHGLVEIEGILNRCIESLKNEPRLVAYVPTEHLDALKRRVDALSSTKGFEGRVVLIAEDGMKPSDCRVEWADGGMERSSAAIWAEIEAILDRTLALAKTATAETTTDTPDA